MTIKMLLAAAGILGFTGGAVRADVLEMQNGDRFSGKVLSVSASTVVLNSEILGRVTVPRGKIATLIIGDKAAAPKTAESLPVPATTNVSAAPPPSIVVVNTNANLSALLRRLGADTNFVGQVRQQFLAGSPEAAAKYDEMVNGLFSGQLSLADLRRQAQASAQQLRDLKHELGPEADATLDAYLNVLEAFVNETSAASGGASATPSGP